MACLAPLQADPALFFGVIFGLLAEQNKGHLTTDSVLSYGVNLI